MRASVRGEVGPIPVGLVGGDECGEWVVTTLDNISLIFQLSDLIVKDDNETNHQSSQAKTQAKTVHVITNS